MKLITFAVLPLCASVVVACGSTTTTAPTTSSSTQTTTTTAAVRPAPTDAEVKDAFQAFVTERSESGVMLAKSVTDITVNGGAVTVTVDAPPAVMETNPFDNLAELFGVPVAFNDDDGVWLRQTVTQVDVVDANGASLGSMTAAELNKKAVG